MTLSALDSASIFAAFVIAIHALRHWPRRTTPTAERIALARTLIPPGETHV